MSQGYQKISEDLLAPNNPSENVLHHYGFGVKITPALASLLTFLLTVFLVLAAYISKTLTDENRGCLGPPFLYISHQSSKNLLKYTRDGCSVSKDVLWYGSSVAPASTLRDIAIHPYKGEKDALYVANAGEMPKEAPKVLVFGSCSPWNGMRTFIDTIVTKDSSAGAQHTYSLAFDDSDNLYVSFQHTDMVLRFWNGSFQPIPNPRNFTYYSDIHTKSIKTSKMRATTTTSAEESPAVATTRDLTHFQPLHKSKFPTLSPAPSMSVTAGSGGNDNGYGSPTEGLDSSPSPFPSPIPTLAFSDPNSNTPPYLSAAPSSTAAVGVPVPPPYPSKKFKTDAPSVPAVQKIDTSHFRYYDGTFLQFGVPGVHNESSQGIRSIRWVKTKKQKQMWIANEDLDHVLIVDIHGQYVDKIKIKNPIGMFVDEDRHKMVYIGSKKTSKYSGAVYGVDIETRAIRKTFTLLGGILNHPSGIVAYEDTLFVAEQTMNVIVTFNISTERYLKQIISLTAGDAIEQITLSNC